MDHDALFYRDDGEFVAMVVPFLREGLAAGDGAAVATTDAHADLVRTGLGADADGVVFLDAAQWYVRPARTIAAWEKVLRESVARGHRQIRIIGEVRFGTAAEHATWTRYEAALNRAFDGAAAWIVCPYDVRALPPRVLADAARTHPAVWSPTRQRSDRYVDPAVLLSDVDEPVPAVSGVPILDLPIEDGVSDVRTLVRAAATRVGLSAERVDDLVLALSEVASNAVRHGSGRRRMLLWVLPDRIVCEVTDQGTGPTDPLAGYLPPTDGAGGGMGLWLVRHVSDALAIRVTRAGTSVRFAINAVPAQHG